MTDSMTHEDLLGLADGSLITIGCRGCEGLEEHKKEHNNLICLTCGDSQDI